MEQSLAAEEWLRGQEQALREAVEQTEASRRLAVYAYRHGFIEILTLLDSYRSTLNAQSAHLSVKRQLLNNRIAQVQDEKSEFDRWNPCLARLARVLEAQNLIYL